LQKKEMKDGKNIWDVLKAIYFCLLCIPGLIGLIMIASGNGTSTKKTTTPTYKNYQNPYNSVTPQMRPIDPQIQRLLEDARNTQPANYQRQPQPSRTYSPTPDDAYDEGYENGYEQGRYDGRRGYSYGYNYDDDSDYYNYYETRYQEGYEEGYDDGYSDGNSEYEEEEEEEEEDW
jgi:flagellar biosynthesis/type III secretory pathway protein FliH